MEQVTKLSNNKNDLFYSQAELLNFALHKFGVDVYEIIEPEDNETKEYLYAIVHEIQRSQLEKLEQQGFTFGCINTYTYYGKDNNNDAIWIQFKNRFD